MAISNTLLGDVEFCCPWCEEYFELEMMDVSVCVENTDIGRMGDPGTFTMECPECGKQLKITADLDIKMEKVS